MFSKLRGTICFVCVFIVVFVTTNMLGSVEAKEAVPVKTIGVGEKVAIKASVNPKNHTEKIKWNSSRKKVTTVTSKGVVKGKKIGKTKITAKGKKKKSKACVVAVKAAPKSIAFSQNIYDVGVNDIIKLTSYVDRGAASNKQSYYSSNKTVATINSNGVVVAKKIGTCSMVVKTYNNKSATCVINVVETPTSESVEERARRQLLSAVNIERNRLNLQDLINTPELNEVAQMRAKKLLNPFRTHVLMVV